MSGASGALPQPYDYRHHELRRARLDQASRAGRMSRRLSGKTPSGSGRTA